MATRNAGLLAVFFWALTALGACASATDAPADGAVAAPDEVQSAADDDAQATDIQDSLSDLARTPEDAPAPDAQSEIDDDAAHAQDSGLADAATEEDAEAGPRAADDGDLPQLSDSSDDADQSDSDGSDASGDATPEVGSDVPADAAEICVGGLPDCPKSAAGPPGDPPSWVPAECQVPIPPEWIEAGLKNPPDLKVEIGAIALPFGPYADGGWAPLIHGAQGFMHVEVAIRVTGVDLKDPKITAYVLRSHQIGCGLMAQPFPTAVGLTLQADGSYYSASSGMFAVFMESEAKSWKYCGKWTEIAVSVRIPDGRWGQGKIRVRMWDTQPTCP